MTRQPDVTRLSASLRGDGVAVPQNVATGTNNRASLEVQGRTGFKNRGFTQVRHRGATKYHRSPKERDLHCETAMVTVLLGFSPMVSAIGMSGAERVPGGIFTFT